MKYLLSLLLVSSAFAAAPKIEFYLTQYDGKNCLERAAVALKDAGFKMSKGTYVSEDRVGIKGDYKAAIGCSTEVKTSIVFVVAGPNYKKAKKLARALQTSFKHGR